MIIGNLLALDETMYGFVRELENPTVVFKTINHSICYTGNL